MGLCQHNIVFLSSGISPDYLQQYSSLNYAYVNIYHWRKSLSGKNVTKTYFRNSTYSRMAATINCLLLPEKPEIAHEIAQRLLGQKNYPRLSG